MQEILPSQKSKPSSGIMVSSAHYNVPPSVPLLLPPVPPHGPAAQDEGAHRGEQRDDIGALVALTAQHAVAVTVVFDDAVAVVNTAVQDVEDIAGDDGRQGHGAPVLGEAVYAKGVGDDGGVDAEQHTIADTSDA